MISSASIRATIGANAASATQFDDPTGPPDVVRSSSLIRASRRAQSRSRSEDPSVDPSLPMTNSKSEKLCSRILAIAASRNGIAFFTGITTLNLYNHFPPGAE
jgi:hypothetical protein